MEENFKIEYKGIDETVVPKITESIIDILKKYCFSELVNLDLRRMHRIIITSNFEEELKQLSNQTVSKNEITFTNENYAVAVAKIVILPKKEDYEIIPVINFNLALCLITENEFVSKQSIVHYIHHELCHVHDYNKRFDAFPNEMMKKQYNAKDSMIFPIAENSWSEYIANYFSSISATDFNINGLIDSLVDAINRTKSIVNDEILSYRFHADLNKLIKIFQRHGNYLLQNASYVLGYLDGLNKELHEISETADTVLKNSYFLKTWEELHFILIQMRNDYHENWSSFDIFNELAKVIEKYYDEMGFILMNTENDCLNISVPLRPETTPEL